MWFKSNNKASKQYSIKDQLAKLGLLIYVICHCSFTYADELKQIVHYVLHYPPYWITTDKGVSGLHYEMSKRIYQEANIEPIYVVMPYARMVAQKHDKHTQVISYGSLTLDPDEMLYPVPPTLINLYSYSLNNKPPKSPRAYEEQRVVVKRGFPLGEYESILNNKRVHTVEVGKIHSAIQLMLYDRVDYLITLADPFDVIVKNFDLAEDTFQKTNLIRMYGHPIAINPYHEDAAELQQRLTDAYNKLAHEGIVVHKNNQTLLKQDMDKFVYE